MVFQPAQDACLIEMKYDSDNGYEWQNNFHFTKPGFVSTDIDALVAQIAASWPSSAFQSLMSGEVDLQSIKGTDMRTEGAYSTETVVGSAGQDAGHMVAPSTSMVFTLRTALRGRSYRGRLYIGGFGETRWQNGDWQTADVAIVNTYLNNMKTNAATLGWTMVVLSRWHNGAKRATALGQSVVSIVSRSERPGSQRRRNRRP